MNKLEQAARQALEAMEEGLIDDKWYAAKDAMREALDHIADSGKLIAGQTNTQLMEGFRPVSEMIAEHKQDPKKAAAIEKAKMRKAEQKPVAVDESWCIEPTPVNGLLSDEPVQPVKQEPMTCNCGTNPWHDCNESEGCRIKKSLGISSRPVYDQRADHHKMMLGYEIATKYGVFENKAFQLCDEMKKLYAAPVQQEEQEPVAYFLDVKAGFSSKPLYEQVSDEYKNDADVFPLYAAPQPVKQEPVAWQFFEDGKWWIGSEYNHHRQLTEEAGYPIRELYAAPVQQEEQEPVAEVRIRPLQGNEFKPRVDVEWLTKPTPGFLYAAPVRTKDLTDDEIFKLFYSDGKEPIDHYEFARAVISAYKEKNK